MKGISDMVVDCGKFLVDTMQIWTSLQENLNVMKIEEELQAKQKKHDDILAVVKTFLVLWRFSNIF